MIPQNTRNGAQSQYIQEESCFNHRIIQEILRRLRAENVFVNA
jgi:hypothetical protein